MNGDKKVNVDFDLIEPNPVPLQYEIIHCNMSWGKSDLMEMEYLNGFSTNYIEDVELSHGTQEQYVHYHFKLPNENVETLNLVITSRMYSMKMIMKTPYLILNSLLMKNLLRQHLILVEPQTW